MTAVSFSNEIEEISMDGFQVVSGEYFTRRVAYFSPTKKKKSELKGNQKENKL